MGLSGNPAKRAAQEAAGGAEMVAVTTHLPQNLVVLNVRGELTGLEVETAEAFVESVNKAIEVVRRHRDKQAID